MAKVVRDIDRGFRAIMKRVRSLRQGPHVRVGIQGSDASRDRPFGESNLAIAVIHEFGSVDGKIPQRSYLRSTADRERALFQRVLAAQAKRAVVDGGIALALGRVGELGVSKVKQTFDQSIGLKPLKRATEKRKQSTRPLIDTAVLKNSITWKVWEK